MTGSHNYEMYPVKFSCKLVNLVNTVVFTFRLSQCVYLRSNKRVECIFVLIQHLQRHFLGKLKPALFTLVLQ